jgi:hypothetical protein
MFVHAMLWLLLLFLEITCAATVRPDGCVALLLFSLADLDGNYRY